MFLEGLIAFCSLNGPRLDIPTAAVAALQAVLDSFKAAYLKVKEDGNFGSGDVSVKVGKFPRCGIPTAGLGYRVRVTGGLSGKFSGRPFL